MKKKGGLKKEKAKKFSLRKRTKVIIIFVMIFVLLNSFLLISKNFQKLSISIKPNLPFSLNLSAIIFILQWAILFVVGLIAYVRFIRHKKEERVKIKVLNVRKKKMRSETDFDTLYTLLKEKKSLSTSAIAELFKIEKDNALEWGRILENSELVSIEYPAFSDPQIILEGWKKEQENQKKSKDKSKNQKDETPQEGCDELSPKQKEEEFKKNDEKSIKSLKLNRPKDLSSDKIDYTKEKKEVPSKEAKKEKKEKQKKESKKEREKRKEKKKKNTLKKIKKISKK